MGLVRRVLLATVVGVVAVLVAALVGSTPAGASTQRPFYWHSDASGKCLDAQLQSIEKAKTVVQVWACGKKKNKQWYMHRYGSTNQYKITNRQSGRCLSGQSGGQGVAVIVAKCNGSATQRWLSNSNAGGAWKWTWQNAAGGRCMKAYGKGNGAKVKLTSCSQTDRYQRWNPTS